MNLEEIIYKRKSTRSYEMTPLSDETLEKIENYSKELKPLDDNIKTYFKIVDNKNVRLFLPWKAPHYIAIFSEQKEGYLRNVGFIYQQLDLYIQSLGIGSCWIGMGKYKPKDPNFVILIGFGKTKKDLYREHSEFKRKTLSEISDYEDIKLEPARLAPSGTNDQPWYFIHNKDSFDVYCKIHGIIKKFTNSKMNKIDIGIAIGHIYVSNPDTFEYYINSDFKELKGFYYVGSFRI